LLDIFSKITPISEGQDSSVGIATRYGLNGSGIESRWGARFSAPVQTCPGAHPASYTMGTGSFLGVKRPERGHPPLSNAEVKERVELCICSPLGLVACYRMTSTFTFFTPMSDFMKIRPGGAELFHADRRTKRDRNES